jgi:membrane protease subunit HflK
MAWNESGNGKNPWDKGRGSDGPPDLDKIVRDWQRRFGSIFGGRGGGSKQRSEGPGGSTLVGLALLVLVGWAATGLYRVNDAERAVVLRFGAYAQTAMPGLRWHIPWPIEQVVKVNVAQVIPFSQQTRMLTADENIVVVDLVVQYRKADPVQYLFNVRDPDGTLSDVSESAIREVIGRNTLDFVLLEGRAEIALQTQALIQETLDGYEAGITVNKVNLQDTNFPSQVEAAVQDAIKAREDKERLAFEAQSYENDIVPKARGQAARRLQDSEGYKERVIADAEGEASRFTQLLAVYENAPGVTRERLYIETIESVFKDSSKVLLDAKGSGNLIYLPLDKLLEQRSSGAMDGAGRGVVARPPQSQSSTGGRSPEAGRSRGSR